MDTVSFIAILAAALFAVALRNIWFALLKDRGLTASDSIMPEQKESLRHTVWSVIAYLLLFFALAKLLALLSGRIHLAELAILVSILIAHQHLYLAVTEKRPIRYLAQYLGYTTLIVFGGLWVITYWPW